MAVLRRYEAVRFALLFGSRATGHPRPDSDWDVAVYLDDALPPQQRFRLRLDLAGALDADVSVLNDAPPLLAHRALMGRPLIIRDKSAYVRFFVRSVAFAEDERRYRAVHAGARRRRIEEGRFGRP